MNDYERIALVIRYLDEHHTEQPDLATLADCVGLSPFHFHRLFSAWAAITPKDFLQCLTLAHAKDLLRQGSSVLEAALSAGLSGPGRLHDLCVTLEAASPAEVKSGGAGWTILAGFADSPFGKCLVGESPRGISHLSFVESEQAISKLRSSRREEAQTSKEMEPPHVGCYGFAGGSEDGEGEMAALREAWPHARLHRDDSAAARLAGRVFERPAGLSARPILRAFVQGTAFQVRVWRALLQIQPGTLVSYGRLATALGQSTAARAVGTAVGQNPLAYLVPCHRVIRETGVVGDYRWGTVRKRAILAWESSARFAAGTLADPRSPGQGTPGQGTRPTALARSCRPGALTGRAASLPRDQES
ncbi:MAG: methylated-DNA--[protein]-cysteine S-methyltransferase [Verrucomicrobia bacterium]|nr:methylated-DNA--[protein]-cysteine S-methyltransferase [Verrucomicrobiota bacterium]